jgi:mRNA interferase MazF
VDFGQPFGSEPGYRRPAVVVQADSFNKSQLGTVLLVPLTRTLEWAKAPGNVLLRPKHTGLKHPSVANVSQLTVSDRRRLVEKAGALPGLALSRLDEGLRVVLGL